MSTFDQRQEVERIRREREWAAKAQPVVIVGIRVPFWPLVWWLAGVTAGVTLIHLVVSWILRALITMLAPE